MFQKLCIIIAIFLSSYVYAGPIYQTKINDNPSALVPTSKVPKETEGVTIQENLGKNIDLNLEFTDQNGQVITLESLVADGKPVILTFNYYRCKTLCGIQLTNLAESLKNLGWKIGKDFKVITISFDSTDTVELAKEKQRLYTAQAGQKTDDWHFLVGSQKNIDTITQQVGFYYKYIADKNEFSHTAAIFIISQKGLISRYLYGITYKPNDIKFSLMDASDGKIGSTIDKILLFCCNYDPDAGQYTGLAVGLMRLMGVITMIFIFGIIFIYSRRRKLADSKKF